MERRSSEYDDRPHRRHSHIHHQHGSDGSNIYHLLTDGDNTLSPPNLPALMASSNLGERGKRIEGSKSREGEKGGWARRQGVSSTTT